MHTFQQIDSLGNLAPALANFEASKNGADSEFWGRRGYHICWPLPRWPCVRARCSAVRMWVEKRGTQRAAKRGRGLNVEKAEKYRGYMSAETGSEKRESLWGGGGLSGLFQSISHASLPYVPLIFQAINSS